MRTLVYKRTHHGDPDPDGRFGIHDCMGRVRGRDYEAVIGVGGIGAEPESFGIAGKITWIGIGPTKHSVPGMRGPLVTFAHFLYLGERGPALAALAPNLAARIFGTNVRVLLRNVSRTEQAEIDGVLVLARDASPSRATCRDVSKNRACREVGTPLLAASEPGAVPPNDRLAEPRRCPSHRRPQIRAARVAQCRSPGCPGPRRA